MTGLSITSGQQRGGHVALESSVDRLILIGVVHGDPQGYERTLRLLGQFAPEIVTVEISPFSLRYRRRHERKWQRQLARALAELPPQASRHLAIQRLVAQVALPFEVRAARDYGRKRGIAWRPLDLGELSRRHLPRYGPELLTPANLKVLLTTPDGSLTEMVAGEYRRAHRALQRSFPRLLAAGSPETAKRERSLARRLTGLMAKSQRVVHLGGWEHLVSWQKEEGLWAALTEFRPVRLLLDEADRLPEEN